MVYYSTVWLDINANDCLLKCSGCSTLQTWPHFSMMANRL